MKILIGIADDDGAAPVLTLLERLDLPQAQRVLLHAVAPATPESWHLSPLLGAAEAERRERREIARAERYLGALAPEARHRVVVGRPAAVLLDQAEKSGADLVAVNASNRGRLEALFTGSVARAVVSGAPQSVLLARPSEKTGPLHAVFATDHSEYAERCLETLLRLAPRGIGRLTVLTAFPETYVDEIAEAALGSASREVEQRCRAVAERLKGRVGSEATQWESIVQPGRARDVIAAFLTESGADLLILGAKGHSFIERIALGSVSFEQAVGAYPWSVLLLRDWQDSS